MFGWLEMRNHSPALNTSLDRPAPATQCRVRGIEFVEVCSVVKAHVKYGGLLLVLASALVTETASAKCASISTKDRFAEAETVVLVSITGARDGPVPWPYGLRKGALPGRLLTLRVLRSWKGGLRPDEVVHGWTLAPGIEHAYPSTHVGAQIIVFYPKGSAHEILSCTTAAPDRIQEVSEELDTIVGADSRDKNP